MGFHEVHGTVPDTPSQVLCQPDASVRWRGPGATASVLAWSGTKTRDPRRL